MLSLPPSPPPKVHFQRFAPHDNALNIGIQALHTTSYRQMATTLHQWHHNYDVLRAENGFTAEVGCRMSSGGCRLTEGSECQYRLNVGREHLILTEQIFVNTLTHNRVSAQCEASVVSMWCHHHYLTTRGCSRCHEWRCGRWWEDGVSAGVGREEAGGGRKDWRREEGSRMQTWFVN